MTMKCETAQERIALAVYGELADDQKHQLEQHLSGCDACLQEWEGAQALAKAMSLLPVEEPSANLVARSRMRLEEALDALPRGGWLSQLARQFTQGVNRLRSAPVAASALLVVGLSAGAYGGFWSGEHAHASEQSKLVQPSAGSVASNEDQAAPIANVSSVVQQPGSKNIEVRYDRLLPRSIQGSSDDPAIRQLLLLGAQNRLNPDVRASSVALLADGCRNRHLCDDAPVRNTLMVSLLYDSSLPVRLKALDGLQPYIANDTRVRDAVLQSLLNDPDTQVKTQAIGLLEPVQGDSSVREVLHTVAARDDSPQIRDVSQQVLNQVQQIQ
jgi:anti-sigma factor RsiW